MDAPNRIADTLESLGVVSFHALSKKASEHREVSQSRFGAQFKKHKLTAHS